MVFIPSRYFIQFLQTPIMVLIYIYKEVKLGYEFLTLGGPQCLNLWFPRALACGIFFCEGYNNLGGVSWMDVNCWLILPLLLSFSFFFFLFILKIPSKMNGKPFFFQFSDLTVGTILHKGCWKRISSVSSTLLNTESASLKVTRHFICSVSLGHCWHKNDNYLISTWPRLVTAFLMHRPHHTQVLEIIWTRKYFGKHCLFWLLAWHLRGRVSYWRPQNWESKASPLYT